jgi:transcriptional regulator with XRE-family HTH domain
MAMAMHILALVGKNIVRIRNERNISQEQVSFSSKLTRSYLSQIEAGRRNLSVEVLARIASALGVGIEELVIDPDKRA